MDKKIKVAFVKYDGLSAGGTEKFLQTIAANLDPEKFEAHYFYCEPAPTIGPAITGGGTNVHRRTYLESAPVTLHRFSVGQKDLTSPTHQWLDTNFFEIFNEADYDIVQTGRAGHKEFPFTHIRSTPIVDSLHLNAGVDNQYNIARVMHICQWNADNWIKAGGDHSRVVLVSHPMEILTGNATPLREELSISEDSFVYGFHQRDADDIFSPLPLQAYKQLENDGTHFVLMGGSKRYREQAVKLGIKNISFVTHDASSVRIYSFLQTLNVYAHGRKDGEVNSTAMAEALYFGLPIVSHTSPVNNGHVESIGNAGVVVDTIEEYVDEMQKLKKDKQYYEQQKVRALHRFAEHYELHGQIEHIESIYKDIIETPFPHALQRFFSSLHWTQNIRQLLKWVYLKITALRYNT